MLPEDWGEAPFWVRPLQHTIVAAQVEAWLPHQMSPRNHLGGRSNMSNR